MNKEEFAELAAGYALGALSPEDLAVFETARAQHPEWQRQVTDAETSGVSSRRSASSMPPASAPQRSEPPAPAPPLPPAPEPAATEPTLNTTAIQAITRRNWTRGMLVVTASVLILVALGFGSATLRAYLDRPAAVVALAQIEGASDAASATAEATDGGTVTLHWSPSLGKAVLVTSGLPRIAADKSFEVWYLRDGKSLSAGRFEHSEDATVSLDGAVQPGDVVTVTLELRGGAPGGQPTSDPIVRIPTS